MADMCAAFFKRDKKGRLLFRTIFILGLAALAGFAAAICIHAQLKANGDILEGIKVIIQNDVMKRTVGADYNDWNPNLWPSFNASVWEVCCKYFDFSTNVLPGIPGECFPLLCCIPLLIFAYDYKRKQLDAAMPALYIVFFLTAVSWFVLAKSHSYIHTHMNYVLWYFGFVQICFYVIANKLAGAYRKIRG